MTKTEALAVLREHSDELRRRGVSRAALFGSVARGDAPPDSELGILVELDPTARLDLFDYVGIVRFIEGLFPVQVDVADREGLKAHVRPAAERDAIYAF
jgi:predicted nucleotidyltransferase